MVLNVWFHKMVVCMVLLTISRTEAVQRVPIHFEVPPEADTYTGIQPATFGIPFEKGQLRIGDGMQIVDSKGKTMPAQFEVTATWGPESTEVRWLLVDLLVQIRDGRAKDVFLEFGPKVGLEDSDPLARKTGDRITVNTGALECVLDSDAGVLGQFVLKDGSGKAFRATTKGSEIAVEKSGPVRAVVRMKGDYLAEDGQKLGEFITRVRFWKGQSYARIYHTLVWGGDQTSEIGCLTFVPEAVLPGAQITAGVDGARIIESDDLLLRQTDWNVVQGSAMGKHIDGWIQLGKKEKSLFLALRWPWQQYPTSISGKNGRIELGLIGPDKPMDLTAEEVAVPYVRPGMEKWNLRIFDSSKLWHADYNGPSARPHISPRGVAKTFEILIWYGEPDSETTPEVKNTFAQHPVLGFASPEFATKAMLPSPMSPKDKANFPLIEGALERAFHCVTRENAFDGDYGTWNFGDIQWSWIGRLGYTTYRYWMNHGKGWSIVPWVLWLRSGEREYWENGEANSRHVMDVDTCHIPEWEPAPDGKIRGGQYHYSALHWGYGPHVSSFFMDSEYLPYCYYLTGYERAKDILLDRVEALARDPWKERVLYFRQNPKKRSRHLYVLVKDLAVLYEATWDGRILPYLKEYLDLTLDAQISNGRFANIVSNHYLDQPLNIALRVFPGEKERILKALYEFQEYQGGPVRSRSGSAGIGPMSLWTTHTLSQDRNNPLYLETIAMTSMGQAWSVAENETIWNGLTEFDAHLAGPMLRDWVIAIADQAERGKNEESLTTGPPLFFNAQLPLPEGEDEGWEKSRGRHLVLALVKEGQPLTVNLHFMMHNQGQKNTLRVRVTDPENRRVADILREIENSYTEPEAVQGIAVQIPTGPGGVYAIELWSKVGAYPVRAESTDGKVVHVLPPGRRAVCSPTFGGQGWFRPKGNGEILIGYPGNFPGARVIAFDPSGRIAGASQIHSTRLVETNVGPRQQPVGKPCRFQPDPNAQGLYSFITANNDWHAVREMRGMLPWVSGREESWFDPHEYPHPDLIRLIGE